MHYRFFKNIFSILVFLLLGFKSFSQPYEAKNQKDFKAKAEKYFDEEDYNESYKSYSQLVANFSKDPIYNYRLGVSMLFAEPDKSKAKKYLDFAAQYKNEIPKEYMFYLGKYYHYNYEFDQAIKLYDNYKLLAKKSDADRLKVDNEIKACESGKNLLNKISDLTVLDKKELPRSDFFLSYDFNNLGGRLISKPTEFKSERDLKKKDNSVAFISTNTNKLFISNYNTDKTKGKDIYVVKKRGDGWGTPQNISTINTEMDEDFPFLHPNGKTLYFASKGHNTMGGYDIFKSEYDESNDTWGAPVNLDFPINTPLDDILFATDSTEKYAYFASNRSSEGSNFTIYKINTQKKAPELISIQGLSVKLKSTENNKSVLTVVNKANGEVFGPITATDDGKYLLQIVNGGKFEFTVETPGFRSQTQEVQLKQYEDVRPVLQFITYNEGQLSIKTYLDTTGANNYARMLEIIKQRSSLSIDTNKVAEPQLANIQPEKIDETKVIQKSNEEINPAAISEQQIIQEAKEDAIKAKAEAASLSNAYQSVNQSLDEKKKAKTEAANEVQQINEALKSASKADSTGFIIAIETKQNEVKALEEQRNLLEGLSNELKINADKKTKESDLLAKYAQDIAMVSKAKDKKAALDNLDLLQRELEVAGNNIRSSKDILDEYTDKAIAKSNEGEISKQQISTLQNDIKDFNNEKEKLKEEQAATKDMELKTTYKTQIEDLERDISEKEVKLNGLKQQAESAIVYNKSNDQFIASLNEAVEASKNTDFVVNNPKLDVSNSVIPKTVGNPTLSPNNVSNTKLSEEYLLAKQNLAFPESQLVKNLDAAALKTESEKIVNYNKAIDKEINTKKTANLKAKTTEEKNKIRGIMDDLIAQKQSNNKIIADIKSRQLELAPKTSVEPVASARKIVYSNAYETIRKEGVASTSKNVSELNAEELTEQKKVVSNWNVALDKEMALLKSNAKTLVLPEEKSKSLELMNDLKIQKQSNNLVLSENSARQLALAKPALTTDVAKTDSSKAIEDKPTENLLSDNYASAKLNFDSTRVQDISNLDMAQLGAQKKLTTSYNAVIDKEVKDNKAKLASTSNVDEKFKINSVINDLNARKKENSTFIAKITQQQNTISLTNAKPTKTIVVKDNNATSVPVMKKNDILSSGLAENELASDSSKAGDYVQSQLKTKTVWDNNTPSLVKSYYKEVTDESIYFSIFSEDLKRMAKLESEISVLEKQKIKAIPTKKATLQNTIDKKKSMITVFKFDIAKNTRNLNRIALSRNKTKLKTQLDSFSGSTENREMGYGLNTYSDKRLVEANQLRDSVNKVVDLDKKLFLISLAEAKEKQALGGLISGIELTGVAPLPTIDSAVVAKFPNDSIKMPSAIKVDNSKGFNSVASIDNAPNIKSLDISTLTSEKTAEVKGAVEYKSYANLKSDAKKLESSAKSIESRVNNLKGVISRNENSIKSLTGKPYGENRIADLNKSNQGLSNQVDSLNEIVFNTKAAAEAKHLEADLMLYSLDETRAAEIVAVSGMKPISQRPADSGTEVVTKSHDDLVNNDLAKLRSDSLMARLDSIRAANDRKPAIEKPVTEVVKSDNTTILPFGNAVGPYTKNQVDFNGEGYSKANPIPVDQPLPDGLIFKVQIGAFKTRPDDNAFGKISPIVGENTANGYTRYTAGVFDDFAPANGAKGDLTKNGFKDAYVVAYFNGKRISLDSARKIKGAEPITVKNNAITLEKANTKPTNYSVPVQNGIETKAIEVQEGLAYTVQIGAYSRVVTKKDLYNLDPIYTEKRSNTLYSFTTGLFATLAEAIVRKNFAVSVGVRDAFVRAFKDGKRITLEEARQIETGGVQKTITPVVPSERSNEPSIEPRKPEIINANSEVNSQPDVKGPKAKIVLYDDSTFTIIKFDNGVEAFPIPDAENGVKIEDSGVSFRVQIGVFQGDIPEENAIAFRKIKNWPIRGFRYANGLTKYNVGNFSNPVSANALKKEALAAGLPDAFVIAYFENKRVSVADAMKILENGGKR